MAVMFDRISVSGFECGIYRVIERLKELLSTID